MNYRFLFSKILFIPLFFSAISVQGYDPEDAATIIEEKRGDSPVEIHFEVPPIDASPYFRPYVAIWLETLERKPVATLALWYHVGPMPTGDGDGGKWLKDLRQWWRKTGRSAGEEIDAITSATRKPGTYRIGWNGADNFGQKIPEGKYLLNFEASREDGGRDYKRQEVTLGENSELLVQGDIEMGLIQIKTQKL